MRAAHPCRRSSKQKINNGRALRGRRLLGDSDRRLGVFREKGGVGYPENEMPEQAVQEARL